MFSWKCRTWSTWKQITLTFRQRECIHHLPFFKLGKQCANTMQTPISANVFIPKNLVQKGWNSPPSLCHGNPTCYVMFSVQTDKKEFGGKLRYVNSSSCSGSMKSWLNNWCQDEFGQLIDVCIAITQSNPGIWNSTVSVPHQNTARAWGMVSSAQRQVNHKSEPTKNWL